MADNHNTPDQDLPDPRPPRQHPPIMELSFAALGSVSYTHLTLPTNREV